MFLPLLLIIAVVVVGMVVLGLLIQNFVMYPKIFNKLGKKGDKAQTIEQSVRYREFYKKLCLKDGSTLFFYNILSGIDKYGIILVKIVFLMVFIQMSIIVVTGLLNGQFHYVG